MTGKGGKSFSDCGLDLECSQNVGGAVRRFDLPPMAVHQYQVS